MDSLYYAACLDSIENWLPLGANSQSNNTTRYEYDANIAFDAFAIYINNSGTGATDTELTITIHLKSDDSDDLVVNVVIPEDRHVIQIQKAGYIIYSIDGIINSYFNYTDAISAISIAKSSDDISSFVISENTVQVFGRKSGAKSVNL